MSEAELQKAVCDELKVQEGLGRLKFFAVPNARNSRRVVGFKKGAPDLTVLISHGPALLWELKTKDGSASMPQIEFLTWCNSHGHSHSIITSVDDAKRELRKHQIVPVNKG